jgi:hypothetical protein
LLISILLLGQGLVSPVNAEWGRTAEDYIRLPLHQNAKICSDGNGGCWATAEIAGLSHVDRNGNMTWGDEPFSIFPGPGYNPIPVLAANGDVIIGMEVAVEPNYLQGVYLQRVNLDREFVWGENGILVDSSNLIRDLIGMYKGPVADTYLIHWTRWHEDRREMEPRLQLINGNGNFLWGVDGIGLDWTYYNTNFAITSDHCIIAAQNIPPNPMVAIVKINAEGERLWDSRFSTLWEDLKRRTLSDVESDRAGGVILVYEYERYENVNDSIRYYGINVMRVSCDGDSLWTRQAYEREIEYRGEPFGNIDPIINYADYGHFFIAWADYPHSFQVVALDIDGEFLWDEPVDVILNPVGYYKLDAVDSHNAVCYVWTENAERGNGVRQQQWGDRGRAIQARNVDHSSITTDGNGGVITVVEYNPTVQMINRNGEIGVVLETPVDDDKCKQKSLNLSPQLLISPNPGNTHFRIEYDTGIPGEMFSYGIYNLLGRTIKTGKMLGGHYLVDDLSRFSSGEYILRLQSTRTTVSTRFLLVK